MTTDATIRMLDAYIEQRVSPGLFLSSFFRTPPKNFHNAEHVEIDVKRGEPRIAIPVPSITSGARKVESTKSTNKKFTPPVYDMEVPLSAYSSSKRLPGEDPFENPDFRKKVLAEAFEGLGEVEDMIRRSVEVQASQILQTGKLVLADAAGVTMYDLDFVPKTSHYAAASVVWAEDGSTGDPMKDIDAMGVIIRRDSKHNPTDLIFGTSAMQRFLANASVQKRLDNLGLQNLAAVSSGGVVAPGRESATSYGTIVIGHYRYRLWMYDGYYIDPQAGTPVPYVGAERVIMLAESARRDLTFGAIPMFVPPDARAQQFLPQRMSSPEQGFDLTTNVWVTPDGKHLTLSAGTRALALPTALDGHGCIDVTP